MNYESVMRWFARALSCAVFAVSVSASGAEADYAVVVSEATAEQPEWRAVVDALVEKHAARVITYAEQVDSALAELTELFPRYACFVARPEEIGKVYVSRIHVMTRKLDDDPYGDVMWGIVTGYTPEDALRVAGATEPQVIRSSLNTTFVNDELFRETFWISDGKAGDWGHRKPDGTVEKGEDGDADRTELFIKMYEQMNPDLLVTSAHASQRNLEMPFSRGNLKCKDGKLYGVPRGGDPLPIKDSPHPKVYFAAGNCLIGDVDKDRETMVPAWLGSAGVNQLVGYTVTTWFGKGGWGTLKMWEKLPGRLALSEAAYLNNQRIIYELQKNYPASSELVPDFAQGESMSAFSKLVSEKTGLKPNRDNFGLLWDRDTLALYGDPSLLVRLSPENLPHGVATTLEEDDGVYTFRVKTDDEPARGGHEDQPLAMMLPTRITGIELVSGEEFEPVVADNFLMLMKPAFAPNQTHEVVFRATAL